MLLRQKLTVQISELGSTNRGLLVSIVVMDLHLSVSRLNNPSGRNANHQLSFALLHRTLPGEFVPVGNTHLRTSAYTRSALELASIINESLDALFGFNLRLSAATAQRLTDGVDAVVQKCAQA